ncbi:DUF732 domain-containing protein [Prescottella defluvii]|uniref:DUF732 domain-containing protein n=1 Tax=Prescottella defluvii TaxID=1323361 RepID=UPI0004F3339C|nr:DUF732 domain-containing protein [Prescottella defluvii]
MTSTRAVTVAVAAVGVLLLAGCSSADPGTDQAGHDAAASSTARDASPSSTPTQVPTSEPTAPPPPSTESLTAAAPSTSTLVPTTPVTTVPAAAPLPPAPRAAGGNDSRSPEQIVGDSGERGQRYLGALRAAGIPPTGMDAAEVLYAQGTCDALARGDSRASVLAEFDSVGGAYAQFLPMSASQIAEVYVSTAERTYC